MVTTVKIMENEKKIVYEIVLDCWGVVKNRGFVPMDDGAWQELIRETEALSQKWQAKGTRHWMLYRKIMNALLDTVEAVQKGGGKDGSEKN